MRSEGVVEIHDKVMKVSCLYSLAVSHHQIVVLITLTQRRLRLLRTAQDSVAALVDVDLSASACTGKNSELAYLRDVVDHQTHLRVARRCRIPQ